MTLNKLCSSLASISLPVAWEQQNNSPRRPPGLEEVMYEKAPCSNARHTSGTKRKLILVFWKCSLERMPLKTSAMWKINSSTGVSKQRQPDDGSRLTLAQVKPPVPTQRVRGLYRVPSSGRRAGHGAPSDWRSWRTRESDRMETVPSPLHYNFSTGAWTNSDPQCKIHIKKRDQKGCLHTLTTLYHTKEEHQ